MRCDGCQVDRVSSAASTYVCLDRLAMHAPFSISHSLTVASKDALEWTERNRASERHYPLQKAIQERMNPIPNHHLLGDALNTFRIPNPVPEA